MVDTRALPDPIKQAPMVINLWSGPRNVSTALMYSFAQRSDTRVLDEPLYGHYLRVSGAEHPAAAEVMEAMDCDGERVMRRTLSDPGDRPLRFLKQMAHHLVDLDEGFLDACVNVLLIRDPREMLPSLVRQIPQPVLRDTGLERQSRLLSDLRRRGQSPPILDARELLLAPAAVLRQLCAVLGIAFDPAMLAWPAGPRPEDGVWAPHWYHNVHRSTGFQPYRPRTEPFPESLRPLLDECLPIYLELSRDAIRASEPEA